MNTDTQLPGSNASFLGCIFYALEKTHACDRVAVTERMSDFHEIRNWLSSQEV